MQRIVVTSLTLVFALGVLALAEDSPIKGGSCPVSQNLSKLILSWKQAAEEAKAQAPAEQEKTLARFVALAKECPAGSRIGPSLVAARDVLVAVKTCTEANAKNCPLATATPEQKKSEPFVAGEALVTARGKLLSDLLEIATYATACSSGSACCASETTLRLLRAESRLRRRPTPALRTARRARRRWLCGS